MPRAAAVSPLRMKQEASFFDGKEPILVYIAKKLKDALRLESVLTEAGVDYGVEPDHYYGGIVFRSRRVGAFFYVPSDTVETTHRVMHEHGYRPYEGQQPSAEAGGEPPRA